MFVDIFVALAIVLFGPMWNTGIEPPYAQAERIPAPTTTTTTIPDAYPPDWMWDKLAQCESGQTWNYNGSSGYDGGLQFLPSTWTAYGGREFSTYAWGATREQQIIIAERVYNDVGWVAWPGCTRSFGWR